MPYTILSCLVIVFLLAWLGLSGLVWSGLASIYASVLWFSVSLIAPTPRFCLSRPYAQHFIMDPVATIKSSVVVHVLIPTQACGAIIGKGGEQVREMSDQSHAHVNVLPEDLLHPGFRRVRMVGSKDNLATAQQLLHGKLQQLVAAGQPGLTAEMLDRLQIQVAIQQDKIGRVIGKAGAGFKDFHQRFDINLKVDRACVIEQNEETRTVTLEGKIANCILAQAELLRIESQAYTGGGGKRKSDGASSYESPFQQPRLHAPQGFGQSPYASQGAPSSPYAAQSPYAQNPQTQYGQYASPYAQAYGQQYAQAMAWGMDPQQQYVQYAQMDPSNPYAAQMHMPQMHAAPGGVPQAATIPPTEPITCRFTCLHSQAGHIIGKAGTALTQTRTQVRFQFRF